MLQVERQHSKLPLQLDAVFDRTISGRNALVYLSAGCGTPVESLTLRHMRSADSARIPFPKNNVDHRLHHSRLKVMTSCTEEQSSPSFETYCWKELITTGPSSPFVCRSHAQLQTQWEIRLPGSRQHTAASVELSAPKQERVVGWRRKVSTRRQQMHMNYAAVVGTDDESCHAAGVHAHMTRSLRFPDTQIHTFSRDSVSQRQITCFCE